jgi:hypothetical protein
MKLISKLCRWFRAIGRRVVLALRNPTFWLKAVVFVALLLVSLSAR